MNRSRERFGGKRVYLSSKILCSLSSSVSTAYVTHHRSPPRHRDRGTCAGESRFLRRHPRDAAGQEERQSGRPVHVPPVLRGWRGARRLRSDLLPVGAHAARPRWHGAHERDVARGARRLARLLGRSGSRAWREDGRAGHALRRAGASLHRRARARSSRSSRRAIRASSRRGPEVRCRWSTRFAGCTRCASRSGIARSYGADAHERNGLHARWRGEWMEALRAR